MRLLYVLLWGGVCFSLEQANASLEKAKELVQVSKLLAPLQDHFGAFSTFGQDVSRIRTQMTEQGLSSRDIDHNLAAMAQFSKAFEKARRMIEGEAQKDMAMRLEKELTPEEIQALITFFKSPALKKFQNIAEKYGSSWEKKIQRQKVEHLAAPFQHMRASLIKPLQKKGKNASYNTSHSKTKTPYASTPPAPKGDKGTKRQYVVESVQTEKNLQPAPATASNVSGFSLPMPSD